MFSDQKYRTGRCQTFPFLWRPAGREFVIFVPACWSHHSMPGSPFVPLLYYFTWLVFCCRLVNTITKNARATLEPLQHYQKPRSQWSEKIEIFLQQKSKCSASLYARCIAFTKRDGSVSVCCACTPICPVTHTFIFSSFTHQQHCTLLTRILSVFWF